METSKNPSLRVSEVQQGPASTRIEVIVASDCRRGEFRVMC